jgi:hypothetical protein
VAYSQLTASRDDAVPRELDEQVTHDLGEDPDNWKQLIANLSATAP